MTGRRQPALAVVALALLLLGPVVILPGALNRFVLVKVACVAAGAGLAFLLPAVGRLPRPVVLLLAGGGGLLVVSALFGDQPLAQLVGRAPRFEGLAVLPVYVLAGAAGARLLGPGRTRRTEQLAVRLLACGAIAVGLLSVVEALGFTPLSSSVTRAGSLFGNASDQGAWAVLALGLLAASAVVSRDPLAWCGATAAAVTVATSESRGALVAAVVALVALALLLRERRAVGTLAAASVAVVGVALLVPAARSRVLSDNALAAATVSGRRLLWDETWQLFLRHPWVGVGPSGFGDSVVAVHSGKWYVSTGTEMIDSPHSWLLQALLAGGPLLLLLAVALAGMTGWAGLRAVRAVPVGDPEGRSFSAGMLAGLIGYGVALLVHLTSPGPTAAAAVFGGALLAVPAGSALERMSQGRVLRERVVATLACLLAVVLLAGAFAELALKSAVSAVGDGDLEGADHAFALAQRLRPWDPDLAAVAGHAFAVVAGAGNQRAATFATPWLDSARLRTPSAVSVLADLASVAEAQQDFAGAGRLLDEALGRDGSNPQLLLQRGVVYAESGDYANAEKLLLRAASLAPHSPDPWTDLARVYTLQGRAAEAAAAQAKALARTAGP